MSINSKVLHICSFEHRIIEPFASDISRVNINVCSCMQFDFILTMKDETFGRPVCWIEDYKGCQDIAVWESFLHMGNEAAKEFHSCVLLDYTRSYDQPVFQTSSSSHFSLLYELFLPQGTFQDTL